MDRERYETGLKVRAEVLGEEYVNKAVQGATDFNREFQNLVTEYCWGEVWGSPHLDRKQRSILTAIPAGWRRVEESGGWEAEEKMFS